MPAFYRCLYCQIDVVMDDLQPDDTGEKLVHRKCGLQVVAVDEAWDKPVIKCKCVVVPAGQRRRSSMAETLTSTAAGLVVSLCLQYLLFPGLPHLQQLRILAIFTIASLLRGYIVRRIFNRGANA